MDTLYSLCRLSRKRGLSLRILFLKKSISILNKRNWKHQMRSYLKIMQAFLGISSSGLNVLSSLDIIYIIFHSNPSNFLQKRYFSWRTEFFPQIRLLGLFGGISYLHFIGL